MNNGFNFDPKDFPPIGFPAHARSAHHHGGFPRKVSRFQIFKVYLQHLKRQYHTWRREIILDPNHGSDVKVERYVMGLCSDAFTLGIPIRLAGEGLHLGPSVTFRAQNLHTNAPVPSFVNLDALLCANVNVLIGTGLDAFTGERGLDLDLPTMLPSNKFRVSGMYSGLVPPGYESEKKVYLPMPEARYGEILRIHYENEKDEMAVHIKSLRKAGVKKRKILEASDRHTRPLPDGFVTIVEKRNSAQFIFCVSMTGPANIVG